MVRTRNRWPAVLIATAGAMVFVAACAAVPLSALPASTADLAAENLYRASCASCHRLRQPSERTQEQWQAAIDKYGQKARLTTVQQNQLLAWLERNASDAPASSGEAGAP